MLLSPLLSLQAGSVEEAAVATERLKLPHHSVAILTPWVEEAAVATERLKLSLGTARPTIRQRVEEAAVATERLKRSLSRL